MKNNNLKAFDQFVNEEYGQIGTTKRNKLEKGFENWSNDSTSST
jgi:hypothetical protein